MKNNEPPSTEKRRKGTFLLRNIVSDLFYYTGFGEKIDRPDGISAVTILYNEEDWIRYSLLSIKDLVDEYIVMDSSDDRTPEIIRELIDIVRAGLALQGGVTFIFMSLSMKISMVVMRCTIF
jgi:hypothetical protein